ncbi:MAG: tol-pal system-associated acyl-CoA thioesterase [Paracoccus sp. (in: a-proteobacteria)]|uniref:tol-pal system-associated acyl-CoA thioesterase n=1 Tax=Paracoccus sp. TaxID=267 RepID=UPI0026DF5247|nr:tol-pal system-associated acyl-CoA thioesterase [Paracoccus sp. (in: a-proteobacteria)]MDO5613283.1 tol-pal system-associated acyl-CoA thioesterase [Paracoccus sp. (in: a-proteobacteria)]
MHKFPIRIYYEDTDLAGIVYYANYLKFIERARSEWLRDLGVDQAALKDTGIVFAVRRVEADYLSPARFDDLLTVETRPIQLGGSRIVMGQDVLRDGVPLFRAIVTVVCVALNSGRPTRIPASVAAALFPQESPG